MTTVSCDIYACRQPALPDQTVTLNVDRGPEQVEVCDEHKAFFDATPLEELNIGRTFTGQIEVRRVPAKPAEQSE